jgi:hypothetical protein
MSGHGFNTALADWHGGTRRMEWERRAGRLKLDPAKVRRLRRATRSEAEALAVEFDISVNTAIKVRLRKAWTWVKDEE